ncbi:MAG: DUF2846 domain-containing protein [Burkholderiales bacterium]|nr:DUF2846 domain-containing protein [Burkholderiales bacterium]
MWRGLLTAILLAGCVQLPPSPQDIQAKKFESVPGKAVIYLVRNDPDISRLAAPVKLDDAIMGTTYAGTYFRWEVAPGRHRISGYASDNGEITLATEAGKIYFVRQIVVNPRVAHSVFHTTDEDSGRRIVLRSGLIESH